MRKTTQRTIKEYVKDGLAVDITNYNYSTEHSFNNGILRKEFQ